MRASRQIPLVIPVVVGLGFGDEGKGATVDALVRGLGARCVVRFGGGPQAAHHVVTREGQVHAFAQLGAGGLVPGVATALGREMLVDPLALRIEMDVLTRLVANGGRPRVAVDPRCPVVTPWQKWVGRMRELRRGANPHGSCGRGVGEAVRDGEYLGAGQLVVGDLVQPDVCVEKLSLLWHLKLDVAEQLVDEAGGASALAAALATIRARPPELVAKGLADALGASGAELRPDEELGAYIEKGEPIVLEGAHGVLLDREAGFWPHVTQTITTFAAAERLLGRLGAEESSLRLGVTRSYQTRHGAGPLPTELASYGERLEEPHNMASDWQGRMRSGPLDAVLLRYSREVCRGVDALCVTCLDRLEYLPCVEVAVGYELSIEEDLSRLGMDSSEPYAGGGLVRRLPDTTGWRHERRVQLSRLLGRCRPRFERLPLHPTAAPTQLADRTALLIDWLESDEGLGSPVLLASFGPSADARRLRPNAVRGLGARGERLLQGQFR